MFKNKFIVYTAIIFFSLGLILFIVGITLKSNIPQFILFTLFVINIIVDLSIWYGTFRNGLFGKKSKKTPSIKYENKMLIPLILSLLTLLSFALINTFI